MIYRFLRIKENRVYYGNFNDIQNGYNIVKNILKDKIAFDSILYSNQILAIGILKTESPSLQFLIVGFCLISKKVS